MPVANLTARYVQSRKPPLTGRVDYWDTNLEGFGIRVAESGRKTWSVYYRFHGQRRRLSLGTFPAVSLADARERARKALSKVANDVDPLAEKIQIRQAGTLGELSTLYLERHAKKKKSRHNQEWMINRHLLPRWRHVKARDISREDVRTLIENITDGGAPILANRVHALISKMFNFAIGRDWRTDNPCQGIEKNKETSRDRVLSDDEIKKIWDALEQEDPFCQALFKLRILTAQRGGEIRRMKWEDVDLDSGEWVIPASDAKNGVAHSVPLNQQAVETLNTLRKWQQERLDTINAGRKKKKKEAKKFSEWVFPSPRGDDSPFDWEQKITKHLRDASGVDFRPHDLRRTVGTLLTKHCKVDRFILKRILNHVDNDITAVYDRNRYDDQKRLALDTWGRRLKSIIEGNQSSATVVAIR